MLCLDESIGETTKIADCAWYASSLFSLVVFVYFDLSYCAEAMKKWNYAVDALHANACGANPLPMENELVEVLLLSTLLT